MAVSTDHAQVSGTANQKEGSWHHLKPERQTKLLLASEHNHGGTERQKSNLYLVRNLKRTISQVKARKSIHIRCNKQQNELIFVYYFLHLNIQSKRILVLFFH